MELDKKLKLLNACENVKDVKDKFIKERLRNTIIVSSFLIIILFVSIVFLKDKAIKIKRPEIGNKEAINNIKVDVDGINKDFKVIVKEKKLTKEEINSILEEEIVNLKSILLGENKSFDKINKKLNLISEIGDKHIEINWKRDKDNIIKYNGDIEWNNVLDISGQTIYIYATLVLQEIEKEVTFKLTLIPSKEDIINYQLQKYIDIADEYKEDIEIPNDINGNTIITKDNVLIQFLIGIALSIFIVIILYRSYNEKLNKEFEKRKKELAYNYSELVSKLSLYISAGISIQKSLEKIVEESEDKNKYLYKEIKLTLKKIENGMSQMQAYIQFGNRCDLPCYIKLGSLLSQNLQRGDKRLIEALKEEVLSSYKEHKVLVINKAKKAETRLVFPMMVVLVIVIVLVSVPAVLSMSGIN